MNKLLKTLIHIQEAAEPRVPVKMTETFLSDCSCIVPSHCWRYKQKVAVLCTQTTRHRWLRVRLSAASSEHIAAHGTAALAQERKNGGIQSVAATGRWISRPAGECSGTARAVVAMAEGIDALCLSQHGALPHWALREQRGPTACPQLHKCSTARSDCHRIVNSFRWEKSSSKLFLVWCGAALEIG